MADAVAAGTGGAAPAAAHRAAVPPAVPALGQPHPVWSGPATYDAMVRMSGGKLDLQLRAEALQSEADLPSDAPVLWRVAAPPSGVVNTVIRVNDVLLGINGFEVQGITSLERLHALVCAQGTEGYVHLRLGRVYALPSLAGIAWDDYMRRLLKLPMLAQLTMAFPGTVKVIDGRVDTFQAGDIDPERWAAVAPAMRRGGAAANAVTPADKGWFHSMQNLIADASRQPRFYAQIRYEPRPGVLPADTPAATLLSVTFGPCYHSTAAPALRDLIILHSFGTRAVAATSAYRHMARHIARLEVRARAAAAAGDVAGVLAALGPGSPACIDGWSYGGVGYLELPTSVPTDYVAARGLPLAYQHRDVPLFALLQRAAIHSGATWANTGPVPGAAAGGAHAAGAAEQGAGEPAAASSGGSAPTHRYPYGSRAMMRVSQVINTPTVTAPPPVQTITRLLTVACSVEENVAAARREAAALPGLALLADPHFRASQFASPEEAAGFEADTGDADPTAPALPRAKGQSHPSILWGAYSTSRNDVLVPLRSLLPPGDRSNPAYWLVDPDVLIPSSLAVLGAGAITDICKLDVHYVPNRNADMRAPPQTPQQTAGIDRPHAARFRSLPPTTLVNFVVQPTGNASGSSSGATLEVAPAAPAAAASSSSAIGSGALVALPGLRVEGAAAAAAPLPPLAGDVSSLGPAALRRHQARLRAVAGGPGPTRHGLYRGVVQAKTAGAAFAVWTMHDEAAVAASADALLQAWAATSTGAGAAAAAAPFAPLPVRRPCTDPTLSTILLGVYPTETQAALAYDRRARRGVVAALAAAAIGADARGEAARAYMTTHAAALARGQLPMPGRHSAVAPAAVPAPRLPLPTNFVGASAASWGAALTLAAFNVSRARPELFGLFVGDRNVEGTLFGPGARDSLPTLRESSLQRKALAWASPSVRAAVLQAFKRAAEEVNGARADSGRAPLTLLNYLWDNLLSAAVNPSLLHLNAARNLIALVVFGNWLSMLPDVTAATAPIVNNRGHRGTMAMQAVSQAIASHIRLPPSIGGPPSLLRSALLAFPSLSAAEIASPRLLATVSIPQGDAVKMRAMYTLLRYACAEMTHPVPGRTIHANELQLLETMAQERLGEKRQRVAQALAGKKRKLEDADERRPPKPRAPPPSHKPAKVKEVAAPTRASTRVRKSVQYSDSINIDEALDALNGNSSSSEEDDDDEESEDERRVSKSSGSFWDKSRRARGGKTGRGGRGALKSGRGRKSRDDDEHDAGDDDEDDYNAVGGGEGGGEGDLASTERIDRFLAVRYADLTLTPEQEALEAVAAAHDAKTLDADAQFVAQERRQLALRMSMPLEQRRDWSTLDYLVKYRDLSFLECSWVSATYIKQLGSRNVMRARKVAALPESHAQLDEEEARIAAGREPRPIPSFFDEDFITPEKVLAERAFDVFVSDLNKLTADERARAVAQPPDPVTGAVFYKVHAAAHYYVKWRGLPYSDCTWELTRTINDDSLIAAFRQASRRPTMEEMQPRLPARASDWKLLDTSPVYRDGLTLRDYQLEGLNWLVFNFLHQRNSILADEMGLGKTVQTISALDFLWRHFNVRGPFLIVAPLSTLGNWKKEFDTWSDMSAVYYHDPVGGAKAREIIRQHEWYVSPDQTGRASFRHGIARCNVIITSFQVLQADMEHFENVPWRFVVVDEAHALKSGSSILKAALTHLDIKSLLLLTGTPLQNNVRELWSLLNLIDPVHYADVDAFIAQYGELKQAEQVAELQKALGPILLRRVKEDVERSIPPKEETVINVELTRMQKAYYKAIFDRNRSFLTRGSSNTVASLINIEMELRKCCNHPFLLRGAEERETSLATTREQHAEIMINASGKMVLLDKLLPKLRSEGHRVLIFSQFKIMLDLLEELLVHRSYSYERLDGSVRGNDRQAAIDRFNRPDSTTFAFLLSTKAGGQGINLTAADTVIIFDSDWNPQNDVQAMARVHRIGQTKDVRIYRLVTSKTYEAQMFKRASLKLGLSQAVFETGNITNRFVKAPEDGDADRPLTELDKDKMDALLRFGAYAIMDDDNADEAAAKFQSSTIDQILSSSATIRYDQASGSSGDGEGGASSSSGGGAGAPRGGLNLSKATFAAEDNDSKLDMKDPEFWNKLLGPIAGETLLLQMRTDGKLDSLEARNTWVADLTAVMDDVLEARFEGRTHESWDAVQTILMELQTEKWAALPHPLSAAGIKAFREAKAAGSGSAFLLPFPSPTITATLGSEAVNASQQRAKAAAGLCPPPAADGDGSQHAGTLSDFATYWLARLEEGRKVRARTRPVFAPSLPAAAPAARGGAGRRASSAAAVDDGSDDDAAPRRRGAFYADSSDEDFHASDDSGAGAPRAAPRGGRGGARGGRGGTRGGRGGGRGGGAAGAAAGGAGTSAAATGSAAPGKRGRGAAAVSYPLLEQDAVERLPSVKPAAPEVEASPTHASLSNIRIRLSPAFGPTRSICTMVHGPSIVSSYLMPSYYEHLYPHFGVLTSSSPDLQFSSAAQAPAPGFDFSDPATAGPCDDAETAELASKAHPRTVEHFAPTRFPRGALFPVRMPADAFIRTGPTRLQVIQAANRGLSVRALLEGLPPAEKLDQPIPPEELYQIVPQPEDPAAAAAPPPALIGGVPPAEAPVIPGFTYRMREAAEAAQALRTAAFLVRGLTDSAALALLSREPEPLPEVGRVGGVDVVQFNTRGYRVVHTFNSVAKEVVKPVEARTALKVPPPWLADGLPFDPEAEAKRVARQQENKAEANKSRSRKRTAATIASRPVPYTDIPLLFGKWGAAPPPAGGLLDPPEPEGSEAPAPVPPPAEPSTAHEAWSFSVAVCDVCRAVESSAGEPLSRCPVCTTPMHATCCGKPATTPAGFVCDVCVARRAPARFGRVTPQPEELVCRLCSCKGGVYKHAMRGRSTVGKDGAWVHMFCAAWSPTACFADRENLSSVAQWWQVPNSLFTAIPCYVCGKSGTGECVPCAAAGCGIHVHPICALRTGLRLQSQPVDMSGLQLADGTPARPAEVLRLFCADHARCPEEGGAVKNLYRGGDASRAYLVDRQSRTLPSAAPSAKEQAGAQGGSGSEEEDEAEEAEEEVEEELDEEAAAAPPPAKRIKLKLPSASGASAAVSDEDEGGVE